MSGECDRGELTPADYPHAIVRIRCEPCSREGRYRRETVIRKFGKDVPPTFARRRRTC